MSKIKAALIKVHIALQAIKLDLQAIKLELKEEIQAIGQNPNIKPLAKGAYTIKLSELLKADNFSPLHHDFEYQTNFLCQIIDHTEPTKLEAKLRDIVKTGKTKQWWDGKDRFGTSTTAFKFHADVISALNKIVTNNFGHEQN